MFVVAMTFFNFNPSNVNSLECVSMNKQQECNTRTKTIIPTIMSLCFILLVLK